MFRIIRKLVKKQSTQKEVIIPVEGIDAETGAIYEKKVYPAGKEPIYKEQKINGTIQEENNASTDK